MIIKEMGQLARVEIKEGGWAKGWKVRSWQRYSMGEETQNMDNVFKWEFNWVPFGFEIDCCEITE